VVLTRTKRKIFASPKVETQDVVAREEHLEDTVDQEDLKRLMFKNSDSDNDT
jgi:hypothetical protein